MKREEWEASKGYLVTGRVENRDLHDRDNISISQQNGKAKLYNLQGAQQSSSWQPTVLVPVRPKSCGVKGQRTLSINPAFTNFSTQWYSLEAQHGLVFDAPGGLSSSNCVKELAV